MLKIVGRLVFPNHPEVDITISKTVFKKLLSIRSDIFKLYDDTYLDKKFKYAWKGAIFQYPYISDIEFPVSYFQPRGDVLDFQYENQKLPSYKVDLFSLNLALFLKYAAELDIVSRVFTITKCDFDFSIRPFIWKFYMDYRETCTGLPYKDRCRLQILSEIYLSERNFLLLGTELSIPTYIFAPSYYYYEFMKQRFYILSF